MSENTTLYKKNNVIFGLSTLKNILLDLKIFLVIRYNSFLMLLGRKTAKKPQKTKLCRKILSCIKNIKNISFILT